MIEGSKMNVFSEVLIGARIQLKQIGSQHTNEVWTWIQRDRAAGGALYSWILSEDDVARYITEKPHVLASGVDYLVFEDELVIGSIHIQNIDPSARSAEIGYAIEKLCEGRGYMTEALNIVEQELLRLFFQKISIECSRSNVRSIRLAQRCGFQQQAETATFLESRSSADDSVVFTKLLL